MIFDHYWELSKEHFIFRRFVGTAQSSGKSLAQGIVQTKVFTVIKESDFGFESAEVNVSIHWLKRLRNV